MEDKLDLRYIVPLNDGSRYHIKKSYKIDDMEYVIYIRKTYNLIFLGAWAKKYHGKRRYSGESWEFAKVTGCCYVKLEWFEDNLETWYCRNNIVYYQEITSKEFFQLFEEFVEWYNQTEDGSIGVLEVLDLVKSFIARVRCRYDQV